jgi:transposase
MHAVAGIDPHKHTATIAVVDSRGGLRDHLSFPVTSGGIEALLGFLTDTELVIDRVGVEGSGGLGSSVVMALVAAGYDVREVQANRTAERRRRRSRAKTDTADAEAIARETLSDPQLPPAGKHAAPSPAWQSLAAIRDWRASLVLQRVRLLTEAEAILVSLPVELRHGLPSTSRVLPQLATLAAGALDLHELTAAQRIKIDRLLASHADIVTLSTRIKDLDKKVPAILDELGCTLTVIYGIGVVSAMELLVEVGDPHRFGTEAQLARWCGAAPVALSSGEGDGPARRHRLDLGGNRNVNSILHTIHVTQIRCYPPAQAYMAKKTAKNTPRRHARRAHKRHLANVVIRHMWNDTTRPTAPPNVAA